jgi:uncharacterized protein (TIGR00251 family)
MSWCAEVGNGVMLAIRVVPNAKTNAVAGTQEDGSLKIRIQAPPVEGKANKALIRFLARTLKLPVRRITIQSGTSGRNKRILVEGVKLRDVEGLV